MSTVDSHALVDTFERIKDEVFKLQIHLHIYRQFFHHSRERIDLLDRCGREVFICMQISFETQMVMSLSRITDPPGQIGKETLSFQRFHDLIATRGDPELAKKLRAAIKKIRKTRRALQAHRDRVLAHLDLRTAIGDAPSPDYVTLEKIDEALGYLHEYMRIFEQHFSPDTEFVYETNSFTNPDADYLISLLKKGLQFKELIATNPSLRDLSLASSRDSNGASREKECNNRHKKSPVKANKQFT